MSDSRNPDHTLQVALWSRKGIGLHYGGPSMAAHRLYSHSAVRGSARTTLVHAFPGQIELDLFEQSVFLGLARIGAQAEKSGFVHRIVTGMGDTLGCLRHARTWIAEHAPDFQVFHGIQTEFLTLEFADLFRKRGVRTVVKPSADGSQILGKPGVRGSYLLSSRRRRQLRELDAVISISSEISKQLASAGVSPRAIVEIPNGVDTHSITPAFSSDEKSAARERLGIPDRPTVIFCGAVAARKRPHLIVEALPHLRGRNTEAQVLLVGPVPDPSYGDEVRAWASAHGVGHHLFMPGFVGNVRDYLRASDIFCLPSRSEGLPNAALEAMAAGLPLVLTDFSGAADLGVPAGGSGIKVEPDARSISNALADLLLDDLARTQMGSVARRIAEDRFSLDRVAELHIELFRHLADD